MGFRAWIKDERIQQLMEEDADVKKYLESLANKYCKPGDYECGCGDIIPLNPEEATHLCFDCKRWVK